MSLRRLQAEFQAALLEQDPGFIAQVVSTPEADAAARLDIYSQAYRLRLLEVLQSDFPKLAQLLGDVQFDALGRAYIAAHPSRHPSLRWFGGGMAPFLATVAPYREQPVLAEMAAFEWAQSAVFDAADADSVGIEDLAAIAPEAWPELRLQAQPGLRRLDLAWNVPLIWRALEDEAEPPAPERQEQPQAWLLWRRELDIHWRSLTVAEAWAIDAWRKGATFAEICEGLCAWVDPEAVALQAAGWLKGWVSEGLVAGLD